MEFRATTTPCHIGLFDEWSSHAGSRFGSDVAVSVAVFFLRGEVASPTPNLSPLSRLGASRMICTA